MRRACIESELGCGVGPNHDPTMRPRELLVRRIEEHLLVPLGEIGFRYSRSRRTFSRSQGIALQSISFVVDRWASAYSCPFWTTWQVDSDAYVKWHLEHFQRTPANASIGGAMDWNIPGWSRSHVNRRAVRGVPDDEEAPALRITRKAPRLVCPALLRVRSRLSLQSRRPGSAPLRRAAIPRAGVAPSAGCLRAGARDRRLPRPWGA